MQHPYPIITIVIPWYGPDTAGGAEAQARQLAQAIHAQHQPVEVWTTVGRDSYAPPDQAYYPLGESELDSIRVRRFPISVPGSHGIPGLFAKRDYFIAPAWTQLPSHELNLLSSLVSSEALLEVIESEAQARRFIFMPYAFPTSFWGVALLGAEATLLPCLHDEPYAYYSSYRWMFQQAGRMLANSPAEGEFARQLYHLPPEKIINAGEGIDLSPRGDGQRFRTARKLHGPVLLYTGVRKGKNAELLIRYTREYWARRGGPLTLLLTGRDIPPIPEALSELVIDLGYLSIQEKHDAYAAADVFVTPSTIESFSIGLMEAWLQGTPALVNADCAVTREAAQRSGAGLSFRSFEEYAAALDILLADAELRQELGTHGRAWVLENCRWEDVAARTIEAVLHI